VKEGDRVKAGQPLLELWNRDLAAQRELATRQLATSEARRREACILADNARRDADRTQQLAERGSGRGLISICAAGGMGVTAILER
jgi:HlyD family secretion protein